jgi:hypothetical protein
MAQPKNPAVPTPKQLNKIAAQLRQLNTAYKAAAAKPSEGSPNSKRSK